MEKTELVKECPGCGHINDQFAWYCVNPDCKSSLITVEAKESSRMQVSSDEIFNPGNESVPGSFEPSLAPITDRLELVEAFLICPEQPSMNFKINGGDIVGREGEVNITTLKRSNYISRQHARFFLSEGKWQLQNLSKTNLTLVNGQVIPVGKKQSLSNDDEIVLANTTFIFRSQQ